MRAQSSPLGPILARDFALSPDCRPVRAAPTATPRRAPIDVDALRFDPLPNPGHPAPVRQIACRSPDTHHRQEHLFSAAGVDVDASYDCDTNGHQRVHGVRSRLDMVRNIPPVGSLTHPALHQPPSPSRTKQPNSAHGGIPGKSRADTQLCPARAPPTIRQ